MQRYVESSFFYAMNMRQHKYKLNRLKGMNQYNSARAAGYSERHSRDHAYKIERAVIGGILDCLEQAGLTDQYQARLLEELTKATKSIVCDKEITEIEDYYIQLQTLKHIAEIKGHLKGKLNEGNLGNVTVNVHPQKILVFRDIDDNETTDRTRNVHAEEVPASIGERSEI